MNRILKIAAFILALLASSNLIAQTAAKVQEPSRTICTVEKGPHVQKMVHPTYPKSALRRGALGPVRLSLMIDEQGVPHDVKVVKGDPDLAKAITDVIGRWRFKPYKLNGKAVEVQSELILYFHPDH